MLHFPTRNYLLHFPSSDHNMLLQKVTFLIKHKAKEQFPTFIRHFFINAQTINSQIKTYWKPMAGACPSMKHYHKTTSKHTDLGKYTERQTTSCSTARKRVQWVLLAAQVALVGMQDWVLLRQSCQLLQELVQDQGTVHGVPGYMLRLRAAVTAGTLVRIWPSLAVCVVVMACTVSSHLQQINRKNTQA